MVSAPPAADRLRDEIHRDFREDFGEGSEVAQEIVDDALIGFTGYETIACGGFGRDEPRVPTVKRTHIEHVPALIGRVRLLRFPQQRRIGLP